MSQMDTVLAVDKYGQSYLYEVKPNDYAEDKVDRIVLNNLILHSNFFEFLSLTTKESALELEDFIADM